MKRQVLQHTFGYCYLFLFSLLTAAQENISIKTSRIVMAPDDTALWKSWREELTTTRNSIKNSINYSDSLYQKKEFQWASRCYNVAMLMLFDKQFYNSSTGRYNVKGYIQDGIKKFGGYDGVVLWHAYPRIGFDERNQFDFYRQFPGGLDGLKTIVKQFHQAGIRVFIDYNPWDQGTRRENKTDMELLAEIIDSIEADGIFLDTMNESSEGFRQKINEEKSGIVLESELELPVERIYNHHMSWAQWYEDSNVPGVLWNKWFERRHMMHMIRRWDHDHSSELHTAWMNGCGMIIWENIFGTANPWNEQDRSVLRSFIAVQRRFSNIFSGEGWDPLFKVQLPGVFANEWHNSNYRIWTFVNRGNNVTNGLLFTMKYQAGTDYFDLITGKPAGKVLHDSVFINGQLAARGAGAIIAIKKISITPDFTRFLEQQAVTYKKYSPESSRTTTIEKPAIIPLVTYSRKKIPAGMVFIEGSTHPTTISYTVRECGFYDIPNKTGPARTDSNNLTQPVLVSLKSYAMDETPVTNQQYYEFIKASHYTPADSDNFLKHWVGGKPPAGKEDHPVVYVSPDDARSYAKWAGKRLPTTDEWQYAAEGPQHTLYPWGNIFDDDFCNNGQYNGTTAVRTFEKGRSADGIYDLCGNTWEWTESERSDKMTRFVIIKGGSFYKAKGSVWYTDGGAQRNDFSAKFILSNPGLNRCSTIGFRCAVDIAPDAR